MNIIDFQKERARYLMDCLAQDKPIEPADSRGWAYGDTLALAGACLCAAYSHGAITLQDGDDQDKELQERYLKALPPERREALEKAPVDTTLGAAITFLAYLTRLVVIEKFDESYEPHVQAAVSCEGEVRPHLIPMVGFKPPAIDKLWGQGLN